MAPATPLWAWWVSLLSACAPVFPRPGGVRFVQWVTGMVLCWEEPTLTQRLTALGLESRWRVLEHVAEHGAWEPEAVERRLLRLVEPERPVRWGCDPPGALEDTTRHRTSQKVWGTCTFHDASARSPQRAETVRAHNWVEMGALVPGQPWTSLPRAARLYCRKNPRPAGETFRTKTTLAVELLRPAAAESVAPVLAVCAGASAMETVIRPGLEPPGGRRRIERITRLRAEARHSHPVLPRPYGKGRPPKWGPRLAAPQHHVYGPVSWPRSRAWVYGRRRTCRYKQRRCRWAVSGPQLPVHVFVVEVAGDGEPWFLVTAALELSAARVAAAWTARFRQAEGCRDHQRRLGMAECRAWTTAPMLRTCQVQLVALTLLRLLQVHVERTWGAGKWWLKPEWNPRKRHASILALRRLFWRHRTEFSQFLVVLEETGESPQPLSVWQDLTGRAA